jgi:hypothetical protein
MPVLRTRILRLQKEDPWVVGMVVLEASPSLPHVIFLSSPKYLSPAKVITTNIPVNRMAEWLEGNTGEYSGEGSVTAQGRCEGGWSMGLLSAS